MNLVIELTLTVKEAQVAHLCSANQTQSLTVIGFYSYEGGYGLQACHISEGERVSIHLL